MKILIYSDNHWSQYSSIVRRRGSNYSLRLENQIQSINWANTLAKQLNCEAIFCLGDFFDKAELNSEEITALREIQWPENIPYYFIVGNHEMGTHNHLFSSMKVFNLLENSFVFDKPCYFDNDDIDLVILPYILEDDRQPLSAYLSPYKHEKRVIFSHNDLKGLQINGTFVSKVGFDIDEIDSSCDFFINGHLHNGRQVTEKILNIGNLTGQNFSEDASKYPHVVFVLDTKTLQIDVYENPYALNFYKLEIDENNLDIFSSLKSNSVITVKCDESIYDKVKESIENNKNIIESRIILTRIHTEYSEINNEKIISLDHLQEFRNYILQNIGQNSIIEEELSEVTSL